MMTRWLPLLLLGIGGAILTVGDIVMKYWVESQRRPLYVMGLIIYLGGLVFLAESFKYKNIAVASTIFVISNVTLLAIVSWLLFKEQLSWWELVGIALGITSVILLELAPRSME
ncbi:MAG: hypothetical protein HZC01_02410 [Candidatus Kerfeldbacteria bacterium]|nr:hypothetical protein [Candidatus Kerfeldbacteria bacterium]